MPVFHNLLRHHPMKRSVLYDWSSYYWANFGCLQNWSKPIMDSIQSYGTIYLSRSLVAKSTQ